MTHYGLAFDVVEGSRSVRELEDFMLSNRGEYGSGVYEPWVLQTHLPAVEDGSRPAIGWWRDGVMIGDAALKRVDTNIAELKHFRVEAPEILQRRGLGRFLLEQAKQEAIDLLARTSSISSDASSVILQLDTRQGSQAQAFFARAGFEQVGTGDLYEAGQTDVLMQLRVPLQ